MIEVVFLGTGSAVPTLKRNHPAVFLRYKTENILFDCGEGTQKQFRRYGVSPVKLNRIFITHWHGDHILGLPGLIQTLVLNGYSQTLEIFGPRGSKRYMDNIMNMFASRNDIRIKVNEIESSGTVIDEDDFKIIAEEMSHGTRCLAYSFVEKDKTRIDKDKLKKLKISSSPELGRLKSGKDVIINGKKIKAKDLLYIEKGKKISLVLDTELNSGIVKIAKDSDLMICESTYFDESDLAREHKHLTLSQALDLAKKANAKKLGIMHLSQKYEIKEKQFLDFAKKKFKNVFIAEDGMRIEV